MAETTVNAGASAHRTETSPRTTASIAEAGTPAFGPMARGYMYSILRPGAPNGGSLEGRPPLGAFPPVVFPDEATEEASCEFIGKKKAHTHCAAVPATVSMEPVCPVGEYVIFEMNYAEPRPQDGDVVYAFVSTRNAQLPRRWWQPRRPDDSGSWVDSLDLETLKRQGHVERLVIRRLGHDAQGRATLTADMPGFQQWIEGRGINGLDCEFAIIGRMTPHKPILHGINEVLC